MASFVKPIMEKGIVISKTYTEPKAERVDFNGKKWEAREEEFKVEVLSCCEDDFDKVFGIPNGTRCTYSVDKETFNKIKFGDWAKVKFSLTQYEGQNPKAQPISFALLPANK